jgi:hypothetical protein
MSDGATEPTSSLSTPNFRIFSMNVGCHKIKKAALMLYLAIEIHADTLMTIYNESISARDGDVTVYDVPCT